MSPSFAEIAPRYDALRPLSSGDRQRLQRMLERAQPGANDVIVEVGCGTGRLTLPLAASTPARVIGVEPEPRMLEVAQVKDTAGRVDWRRGSAYRLPFADDCVRLVVMVLVVHLLRQRARAFAEVRRVLRPQGQLSVWTFTPRHVETYYLNEYFPSIATIDRPRFPPIETLRKELGRAGFSEITAETVEESRPMGIADVVDRVRGRYISTLSMLPPLEYRLGLQRLEEMLAQDRSVTMTQRSEWAILTASK
jgi:ubiquinone/menaquinone biosynthesis C-methylase UbiE